MKKYLKLYLMFFLAIGMVACEKDEDIQEEPSLEVTNANLNGIWQLYEWNGEVMEDGRFCYMNLDRLEETFTIYENIGSMYARKLTGAYSIEGDDTEGYTLEGTYDYIEESWKGYDVNRLTATRLELNVTDNPDEELIYVLVDEIPEDVLYE